MDIFETVGRSSYLRVDLDVISQNINVLKSLCGTGTEVIPVIKANAYGHGSVEVGKHLERSGFSRFAVATVGEGIELRRAGMKSIIQIFGTAVEAEIPLLVQFNLLPTIGTAIFLKKWTQTKHCFNGRNTSDGPPMTPFPPVIIKIDSGMSRNGCQPECLSDLMTICSSNGVPVDSLMTHFAQAWDDPVFTQQQLDTFLTTTAPYRELGVKVHAANSGGVIQGFGSNLDFVRCGIAMYGLTIDNSEAIAEKYISLGLKPALSWLAKPVLVKELEAGRYVGYDKTYRVPEKEAIATFGIGYADGYRRILAGSGCLTTSTGQQCPVVGRVSMDAITVKLDASRHTNDSIYYVLANDYKSPNCVRCVAEFLRTITYEVVTSLSPRLPRVYVTGGDTTVVYNCGTTQDL